jgi:hypothetical protein
MRSKSAFAEADCPAPIPVAMLDTKIENIHSAIQNKNLSQLSQQMEDLSLSIPCLIQPINPKQAAQFHLMQGIYLWINRNPNLAQLYFSAAKSIDQGIAIPNEFFPAGHQIHKSFKQSPSLPETEKATALPSGEIYFDGKRTLNRPSLRPTIYQETRGSKVVKSMLLDGNDPLPRHDGMTVETAPMEEAQAAMDESMVIVLPFAGSGREDLRKQLSDQTRIAALEALPSEDFTVLSRSKMEKQLKSKVGCETDDCAVQQAKSVGAGLVVSGNLFEIDGVYVLTLKLLNTPQSRLLLTESIKGKDPLEMINETKKMALKMLKGWNTGSNNKAPSCHITGPINARTIATDTTLSFTANVSDLNSPSNELQVSWSSDIDGVFGSPIPTPGGKVSLAHSGFTPTPHVISLMVTDPGGETCTAHVRLNVTSPPEIRITSPVNGAKFEPGDDILFEAMVADKEDANENMTFIWMSSRDGQIASPTPDETGTIKFTTYDLSKGFHKVTLIATDSDGLSSSSVVNFRVLDPKANTTFKNYFSKNLKHDAPQVINPAKAESLNNLNRKEFQFYKPDPKNLPQMPYFHKDFTSYTLEFGEMWVGPSFIKMGITPHRSWGPLHTSIQIGTRPIFKSAGLRTFDAKWNFFRLGRLNSLSGLDMAATYTIIDSAADASKDEFRVQYKGYGAMLSFRPIKPWTIHAGAQYALLTMDGKPSLVKLNPILERFQTSPSSLDQFKELDDLVSGEFNTLTVKLSTDYRMNRRDSWILQGQATIWHKVKIESDVAKLVPPVLNLEEILTLDSEGPEEIKDSYIVSLAHQWSGKRHNLRLGLGWSAFGSFPTAMLPAMVQSVEWSIRLGGKSRRNEARLRRNSRVNWRELRRGADRYRARNQEE